MPANPPSIGNPETIETRTALYFGMIVISIVSMAAAVSLGRALVKRLGAWNAALAAGGVYLALVAVAGVLMPAINEVPESFPAALLWSFRITSLGMQLLLWTALGLAFGALTQRGLAIGLTAGSRAVSAAPAAEANSR